MEVVSSSSRRLHLALPVSRWAYIIAALCLSWVYLGWYWWMGWIAFIINMAAGVMLALEAIPERYDLIVDLDEANVQIKRSGIPLLLASRLVLVPISEVEDVRSREVEVGNRIKRKCHQLTVFCTNGSMLPVNTEATNTPLEDAAAQIRRFLNIADAEEEAEDAEDELKADKKND